MILSDSTIKSLCEVPEWTVHESSLTDALMRQDRLGWPSGILEAAILRMQIEKQNSHRTSQQDALDFEPLIAPFSEKQIKVAEGGQRIISKGLTSYGYDVSLGREFKIFTNINSTLIDPKRLDPGCLVDAEVRTDDEGCEYVILPPNSYILGTTVEYFVIPRNILAICVGKSTYARAASIVNVTPIEPGFRGNVVIEISNATTSPLKIYVGEGIAQFLFMLGDQPCLTSYGDRGGKYQGQTGVTLPRV